MLGLINRVNKLEQLVAYAEGIDKAEGPKTYQPSVEELSEAIEILVRCGVVYRQSCCVKQGTR